MNHRRFHWLEKLQVQLATVAALAVGYFALWPMLRPWDPQTPVTFVPVGAVGQAAFFAAAVWLLAATCAVVTASTRPEGAMVAALIGAGGVSLHSAQMRGLLWWWEGDYRPLFGDFMAEMAFMAAVLVGVVVVIGLVRAMIGFINKDWVWQDPLAKLTEEQRQKVGPTAEERKFLSRPWLLRSEARFLLILVGKYGSRKAGERLTLAMALQRSLACMLLGTAIAVTLALLLMQSGDRGQIIFALFVAFLVAALVSHQAFPISFTAAAWLMPVAASFIFYGLAMASTVDGGTAQAWLDVKPYAQALPIDWLTAGGGGAVLGFWFSSRIHEARHFENAEEESGTGQ